VSFFKESLNRNTFHFIFQVKLEQKGLIASKSQHHPQDHQRPSFDQNITVSPVRTRSPTVSPSRSSSNASTRPSASSAVPSMFDAIDAAVDDAVNRGWNPGSRSSPVLRANHNPSLSVCAACVGAQKSNV
jgi:hypothetical protein